MVNPEFQEVSEDVLRALESIDPRKPLSPRLYGAIARIVPSIAVETVAVRERRSKIEVFMIRRAPDDLAYPNELHSPGSILRSGEDFRKVMDRLVAREFHVPIVNSSPAGEIFVPEKRGWFNNRIFSVKLDGEPQGGDWYPVDNLPDDTVDFHRTTVIPQAAAHFRRMQIP